MRALPISLLVAVVLCASVAAEAKPNRRAGRGGGDDGLPLRFRFGLTLDGARNIELGSRTTIKDDAVLGANAGVSYVAIPKLSLDVDAELMLRLTDALWPPSRLQLTPGARYDVVQGLYVRAGAPVIAYPSPFNAGVLAGAGWRQRGSGILGGYVEVAYERYLLKEESRVVLRGGLEAGN